MKKILFPVPQPYFPFNRWKYALRLAQFHGSEIVVFSTLDEDKREALVSFTLQNVPKQYHSIDIDFVNGRGELSKAILHEEKKGGYELIVMGSQQGRSFRDILFGTTNERIIKESNTNVLVVPITAQYQGLDRLVYLSHFLDRDMEAIEDLETWVDIFDAKLHLTHINTSESDLSVVKSNLEEMAERLEDDIESELYVFESKKSMVEKRIVDFVQLSNTDLIVMTYRKNGIIRSFIDINFVEDIGLQSLLPILILKNGMTNP